MLRFSVFLCLFSLAFTDSVIPSDKDAKIVSYSYQHLEKGNYEFSYVTSNGIQGHEARRLVDEGGSKHTVDGFFSYKEPDGTIILVEYIADENGFRIKNSLRFNPNKEDLDFATLSNRFESSTAHLVASLLGR